MKKRFEIRNESGFGLIHVLAVTLITSIALLGLFITIEYARAQAVENYHTRRALLLAQGYIEEVKYNNRNLGTTSYPRVIPLTEQVAVYEQSGEIIKYEVRVSTTAGGIPNPEPNYVNTYYDLVTVEVTWAENPIANFASYLNTERQVRIQEYYYWERSGVNVQ